MNKFLLLIFICISIIVSAESNTYTAYGHIKSITNRSGWDTEIIIVFDDMKVSNINFRHKYGEILPLWEGAYLKLKYTCADDDYDSNVCRLDKVELLK